MTAPLWLFAAVCIVAAALLVLACSLARMAAVQDKDSETLRQWLGMDGDES